MSLVICIAMGWLWFAQQTTGFLNAAVVHFVNHSHPPGRLLTQQGPDIHLELPSAVVAELADAPA